MKSWWRLVVAVVVLIVVVAVLDWPHQAKPAAAAAKPLVSLTASDVQRIAIQQPGQPEVVLTKTGNDWKLDQPYSFAADTTAVSSLINTLDDITGASKVADATPQIKLASFGLDPAAKTAQPSTVAFGLASGKTITFVFGSDTPTGGNTYFRVGDTGAIEMASSYVKTDSLKSAFDLQDKQVLHFPSGQITALTIKTKSKSLQFAKNSGQSKNAWPKAQSSNISSLIDSLDDAQMNALPAPSAAAADKLAAKDGLLHPAYAVTLLWQGGKETLDIGAKTGAAQYYARNSETPAVFTLSDYLITDITNLTSPAQAPAVVHSTK
ncbi:MAG: DUF4340 domain-containing protein [Terriglobales bacterium]